MAESWVRLWAGTTTDPKFRVIARKSGRPLMEVIAVFTHLMLLANDAEDRGSIDDQDVELIAAALDADEEHINAILNAMQGRVIEEGRLSGWEKRQPVREDSGNEKTGALSSTERVRLFREKKRDETQCNAMKRDETQCNAPEAEAEADKYPPTPRHGGKSSFSAKPNQTPDGLNEVAWERWMDYRKQIRRPIKPVSVPAAQLKLAAYGEDQAEVVEQSIANGWQGLFEPRKVAKKPEKEAPLVYI